MPSLTAQTDDQQARCFFLPAWLLAALPGVGNGCWLGHAGQHQARYLLAAACAHMSRTLNDAIHEAPSATSNPRATMMDSAGATTNDACSQPCETCCPRSSMVWGTSRSIPKLLLFCSLRLSMCDRTRIRACVYAAFLCARAWPRMSMEWLAEARLQRRRRCRRVAWTASFACRDNAVRPNALLSGGLLLSCSGWRQGARTDVARAPTTDCQGSASNVSNGIWSIVSTRAYCSVAATIALFTTGS